MTPILKHYLSVLVPLVVLDFVWLNLAKGFYHRHLGYIFAEKFQVLPVVLFYLAYSAGMLYFVLYPNIGQPMWKVVLSGAFLGLLAYGTYDLTNHATIRNWPLTVTLVDLAWGISVSAAVAFLAAFINSTK